MTVIFNRHLLNISWSGLPGQADGAFPEDAPYCHCLQQNQVVFSGWSAVINPFGLKMISDRHILDYYFFFLRMVLVMEHSFVAFFLFSLPPTHPPKVYHFLLFMWAKNVFVLIFSVWCWALKLDPCEQGGEGAEQQGEPAWRGWWCARVVSFTAQFKQTAFKLQVSGLLLEFLPQLRGSLLAVCQCCGGTRVEVVPISAREKKIDVSSTLAP